MRAPEPDDPHGDAPGRPPPDRSDGRVPPEESTSPPGRAERVVRRIDRFQQAHSVAGFPFAVLQKFGNDQAGAFATRLAYHGLFSLFPLLLLFVTILGFVLSHHPAFRESVLRTALANFPVIGDQLRSTARPLTGSITAVLVGVAGTIYGTFGLAQAAEAAMNTVWNIPYVEWPSFVGRRLRGLGVFAAFGMATIASSALAVVAISVVGGAAGPLLFLASGVVDFLLFTAAFMVLTARPLGWRDVALGAALAAVAWQVLQAVGGWYMAHELNSARGTYGFFAVTIALLSWMYLGAHAILLAAEINVVHAHRLWPRSMVQPPLTVADRRTFARLARMAVRRPEYRVDVTFLPDADRAPGDGAVPDGAVSDAGGGSSPGGEERPDGAGQR